MNEKLEVIANIYNDGHPPNDYCASLCVQGVDSGLVYAYSPRVGSTIDELADDISCDFHSCIHEWRNS